MKFSNGYIEAVGVCINELNAHIIVVYSPGDTESAHFNDLIEHINNYLGE